jgi:hypothetical protein
MTYIKRRKCKSLKYSVNLFMITVLGVTNLLLSYDFSVEKPS